MNRRTFFGGGIAALGGALLGGGGRNAAAAGKEPLTAYLGSFSTWGKPAGVGLEIAAVDWASGQLTVMGSVAGVPDASFLALSPNRRTLYAVSELKPEGRVSALDLSADRWRPTILNSQPAAPGPTHLSVHPSGRHLLSASYTEGSIMVHPLLPDGRIGPWTDKARHEGRSRSARAHQVLVDPSGQWVVAVDLGADSIYVYALEPATGRLKLQQKLELPAGAGPRHLAFHPDGRYAYVLGELRSEITITAWDAASGRFSLGQIVGTLGEARPRRNLPAEIQVSLDGRFVYASNRGHDSIAAFRVEDEGARLAFVATVPTGGAWPRHFTLDPTGRWLYVANQNAASVSWLPRDPETGRLGRPAGLAGVNGVAMLLFR